jgi:hypothetical protein
VTTLRAAIQYIYGLQNLLEEVQTGTLDLARYQLSEAELRPTKQPAKPARNAARPAGSAAAGRKAAPRRKPVNRQQALLANSSGGGVKCSPVTLAIKGSPAQRKPDKKSGVAASAPKEAARYVLPLQPRDASHVLRRDYATPPASENRGPQTSVQTPSTQLQSSPHSLSERRVVQNSAVLTMPPNLLNLRPLPVSSLFPGGAANQPVLPPLQTLRGGAVTAAAMDLPKVEEMVEGRGTSSGGGASHQPFYCTTAGIIKLPIFIQEIILVKWFTDFFEQTYRNT